MLAILLTACSEKEKLSLNIPEGFATQTLKEFARQAGVEIIFDAQSLYGVKTKAVHGEHDPRSALRIMLKGTSLKIDFDEGTGAYAVIRDEMSVSGNVRALFPSVAGFSTHEHLLQIKKMIYNPHFF